MRAWTTALLLGATLFAGAAHAEPSELELAYQREFAYLESEKAALESRIADLDAETRRRVADAEADIGQLQARLIALRSRRTRVEEELSAALRDSDAVTEARDMVDSTLFQADSTLTHLELPEAETGDEQRDALTTAFTEAAARVEQAGTVRVEPGAWFLPSGERAEGQVVHIGQIASFGVGDQAGALVPVGEGKLQLRDTEASATAHALASGGHPQPLGLFAYEGVGKRIEEASEKTLWSTLQAGGIVGAVILVLGVLGVALAAMRALGLFLAGRGERAVQAALSELDAGQWEAARRIAGSSRGAAPRVVAAMLSGPDHRRSRLEDRAAEAILHQTPRIERFGAAILVIAAVAPLLGLLGTVTGMIGTFEVITEFGTGDPRMLSGGISEALVTTQLGLIVAIPMLLIGNLLNRYAERTLGRVEAAAVGVVNRADDGEVPTPASHGHDPDPAPMTGPAAERDHDLGSGVVAHA